MFDKCIDISHHNGTIKWSKVPKEYKLVFVKATQGTRFIDPNFNTNSEGASDTDRMVVPYHFISREPANLQAAHFANVASLHRGSPVMLDWESDDPAQLPARGVVEELIKALRVTTERAPLMYHGIYTISSKTINVCPWFIPKYGPEPKHYKWLFWQDRPNLVLDGVHGPVDHDLFNGTLSEMTVWFTNGTLPESIR